MDIRVDQTQINKDIFYLLQTVGQVDSFLQTLFEFGCEPLLTCGLTLAVIAGSTAANHCLSWLLGRLAW